MHGDDHNGSSAAITGSLLGTAVSDALGLPYEGLSRRRAARMLGPADRYRFFFGRGMVSDDTEHACMTAQALIVAIDAGRQPKLDDETQVSHGDMNIDVQVFARSLAWRLRWWMAALPAGTGFATMRAIVKLWLGVRPDRSGVFSAGNGPAMRAPILGAAVDDDDTLRRLVRASTRLTHTDPKAEFGALAVALAARWAWRHEPVGGRDYLAHVTAMLSDDDAAELIGLLSKAVDAAEKEQTTQQFAESLGLGDGVSGYVYHTVPVAIHAWLTHPHDLPAAVQSVIACGGDADSTAAITGGIVGSVVGKAGIPSPWLDRLCDWPRTVKWMERLGEQLARRLNGMRNERPIRLPVWAVPPRNMFFLLVVLAHGLRRLLPPY